MEYSLHNDCRHDQACSNIITVLHGTSSSNGNMPGTNAVFYCSVSAISFISFLGIFLLSPLISRLVSSKYKHLPVKDQVNWDTRCVFFCAFQNLLSSGKLIETKLNWWNNKETVILSGRINTSLTSVAWWLDGKKESLYQQVSSYQQVSFRRIGSNIHAAVATTISLYAFFLDKATLLDHFCTDSVIVRSGISITFGYILADLLVILWYYPYFQDMFMIIHHIMALSAYIFVIIRGHLLFFGNIRQIAELSTPFVNQRWFFDITGQPRSSKHFIRNGLLMILAFFLGRIIFIPYFYYKMFIVWSYPQRRALGLLLSSIWIITAGILDVINLYWFARMLKGGAKLLLKPGGKKKPQ